MPPIPNLQASLTGNLAGAVPPSPVPTGQDTNLSGLEGLVTDETLPGQGIPTEEVDAMVMMGISMLTKAARLNPSLTTPVREFVNQVLPIVFQDTTGPGALPELPVGPSTPPPSGGVASLPGPSAGGGALSIL